MRPTAVPRGNTPSTRCQRARNIHINLGGNLNPSFTQEDPARRRRSTSSRRNRGTMFIRVKKSIKKRTDANRTGNSERERLPAQLPDEGDIVDGADSSLKKVP
jgi:hypothetical protein